MGDAPRDALILSAMEMVTTLEAILALGGDKWDPHAKALIEHTIKKALAALEAYDADVWRLGPLTFEDDQRTGLH